LALFLFFYFVSVPLPASEQGADRARNVSTPSVILSPGSPSTNNDFDTPPRESPAAVHRGNPWPWYIKTMLFTLYGIIALILTYTIRHYWFTFNRLFGAQRHPYLDVYTADWPSVTILIPAHNEEAVIAHNLEALLAVDYPPDRLRIIPINDCSTDKTKEIISGFVRRFPDRIFPLHRKIGKCGKAAALKDASNNIDSEIVLVFDADYIPGKGLIKQLTAPFFDPEVGAVMGRVVPLNVNRNLLTRLLDMERSGGYQVDQQARMNMHLVPQYGGTVGGVRAQALAAVGGWREDTLAEDTDVTYRLLLAGWKTVYQNRSECYEEVPEEWRSRVRQVIRWAKGHNQATARYSLPLLLNRRVSLFEKIDGLLLLGVYAMSPILLLGWALAIVLFFLGVNTLHGIVAILCIASYGALGNFAAFFEIAAAVRLDGHRKRIRLLAFNIFGFLVSLLSVSRATLSQLLSLNRKRDLTWEKTERFRGAK
jgi:cellulose synthase/poly-beta-1,6-N-acetylglucosamine synthase-like glycosyltransferase